MAEATWKPVFASGTGFTNGLAQYAPSGGSPGAVLHTVPAAPAGGFLLDSITLYAANQSAEYQPLHILFGGTDAAQRRDLLIAPYLGDVIVLDGFRLGPGSTVNAWADVSTTVSLILTINRYTETP
jgi:hypothetical protein